jgi:hypothetical protein
MFIFWKCSDFGNCSDFKTLDFKKCSIFQSHHSLKIVFRLKNYLDFEYVPILKIVQNRKV